MKARQLPTRNKNGVPVAKLKNDPQVIKWSMRLQGDPLARPADLDEDQLVYVMTQVMKRREGEFDLSHYERAMDATAPKFVAPEITDIAGDLAEIFEQPEMEGFWSAWQGPSVRKVGPNYAAAKSVLATIAIGAVNPYLQTAHAVLDGHSPLKRVFSDLEMRTSGEPFALAPYKSVARIASKLDSCHLLAMEANVELLKGLRVMFPDAGIGENLVIDGKAVPAWTPQRSARGNDDAEARMRRRVPNAGFRAYQHTSSGKINLTGGEKLNVSSISTTRAWRGYYLVTLVDLATGLPLVWLLQDAKINEEKAIVPLLSDLHRLWPDIGAKYLAGDSAWDEDEWCRLCEVDYGIHPVFRLHDEKRKGKLFKAGDVKGNAAGFDNHGQLVCGPHKKSLPYDTFDDAKRHVLGLEPGKSAPEKEFRVRGNCTHHQNPCGRVAAHASHDWSLLTYLPHFAAGKPERFALRQALLTRLNAVESLYNRLEAGRLLGSDSGDRTRILSMETHESLISLAFLGMTALTVTEQRAKVAAAKPKFTLVAASPLAA